MAVSVEKLKELSSPVDINQMDFRIAQISEQKDGTAIAQILVYKDARYDMNVLDRVCGPENWQRVYGEAGSLITCGVGILIERGKGSQEWVFKYDTGDGGSGQDIEKSIASDSFKRACFSWGIGRELYDWPKIFVTMRQGDFFKGANGRVKEGKSFDLKNWGWTVERCHLGQVCKIVGIHPSGEVIYDWNNSTYLMMNAKTQEEANQIYKSTPHKERQSASFKHAVEVKKDSFK